MKLLTAVTVAGVAFSASVMTSCKQTSRVSMRGGASLQSVPQGNGMVADQVDAPETVMSRGFPDRFKKELARNAEWQQAVITGAGEGPTDIRMVSASRVWRTAASGGVATAMEELTAAKSQYIFNVQTQVARVGWTSGKVDLAAPIRFSDWNPLSLNTDDLKLEGAGQAGKSLRPGQLSKSGRVLDLRTVEGRKVARTLVNRTSKASAKAVVEGAADVVGEDVEFLFWKDGRIGFNIQGTTFLFRKRDGLPSVAAVTPAQGKLGFFTVPIFGADGIGAGFAPLVVDAAPQVAYTHHNLSVTKVVLVNPDFPDVVMPQLKKAFETWNETLGVNYFQLRKASRTLDQLDCLTLSSLCVFWRGDARKLSAAGVGGVAMPAGDGLTGVVDGGIVLFNNLATAKTSPTQEPPQDLIDLLLGKSMDARAAAAWQIRTQELGNYVHPDPQGVINYVMLHEIGHYVGLRHNFAGSVYAQAGEVSSSIMEYPPYVLRGIDKGLGRYDIAALAAIYGRGGGDRQENNFCSDGEVDPTQSATGLVKDSQCSRMDFGDPADWWIAMAELSPLGALAPVPGSDFLIILRAFQPTKTVDNLAEVLGFFLRNDTGARPEQALKVKTFLCGRPAAELDAVKEQLERDMQLRLNCAP